MIKIETHKEFRKYFEGVMERSNIHAKEYEGKTKNVVWFINKITSNKYCISYNHETKKIEIRNRVITGLAIIEIDNSITSTQLIHLFDQMDLDQI